jgi:SAM-dependent methyltransferase
MTFKDHFSRHVELYRRYRPSYPPEVFAWLASLAPGHGLALDVGTGNGQAAIGLADHFDAVLGTDASETQVNAATPHPKVRYLASPAESCPVEDQSVDLILAAQALHWFHFERFFAECRRVLKPGGIVAALTYFHPTTTPELDLILAQYIDHVRSDWPPERRFVDAGYANIEFPFDEIPLGHGLESPLTMRLELDFDGYLGYLATWSAAQRYRERTQCDPRAPFVDDLRKAWGDAALRLVTWPLSGRIGRV